ncbi:hypothetical protein BegalDRAFT_2415 [Beggiatoa alba B18LD]|uniref:Uncharacterized protein n=1 Tax=Beggiatoa alba B18LD TaxID=395493 RepID=I3CI23_9GAMM|nr:hypothetical protein [Beggiatoa alba]EIJ43266.1 hypothetical protein BegalDRAFT_2415 [Beggiatoa alba B18LD]
MSDKKISISLTEESPVKLPEEIQRIGTEATQAIWIFSQSLANAEIAKIREASATVEKNAISQQQQALQEVERLNVERQQAYAKIDNLTKENKSLHIDLDREIGEVKTAHSHIAVLQEKIEKQEHDIKNLHEELGRARESGEIAQKRLHEVVYQSQQDQVDLRTLREEITVQQRNRERLEKTINTTTAEAEQTWKQLKTEQTKVAVAEALTQELRETIRKLESDIKLLKEDKQEFREARDAEEKLRIELEKKLVAITTRAEAQEKTYKETIAKLEQDNNFVKSEATTLRNRIIKAEGALEREKKAIERLETKLVATSGSPTK